MKKKKSLIILISIITIVFAAFIAAGFYFFNVAVIPGHKNFISANTLTVKKSDPLYQEKTWYLKQHKKHLYMKSADDKYMLDANYLPDGNSDKTAILLHGYMNNKDTMGSYAALFHRLGYNVLMPDARSHGQSQGKYIGYGWVEKSDVVKWIKKVTMRSPRQKIVLFGVSMGGATAMMTSGEKLPSQVKAIIEDCGYSNVKEEIEHEAQSLYHMPLIPRFPLVEILSGINKIKVGYYLGEASSLKQLKNNSRPILFIHGAKDKFVPTKMVYQNYRATHSKKQLWVVPGASHAKKFCHPSSAVSQAYSAIFAKIRALEYLKSLTDMI